MSICPLLTVVGALCLLNFTTANHCSVQSSHTQVWLPPNVTTDIYIPVCAWLLGHPLRYITLGKGLNDWKNLVKDPQGYDWTSRSRGAAKHMRKVLDIKKYDDSYLIVTVNLTTHQLSPGGRGQTCWDFSLWGWDWSPKRGWYTVRNPTWNYKGTAQTPRPGDPDCKFELCTISAYCATVGMSPVVSDGGKGKGIVAIVPTDHIDERTFRTTGLTQQTNNWMLLAHQAAHSLSTSCVVCLGARPLLEVVPAPINSSCVLPLFTNVFGFTNHCAVWDHVYPLTRQEKRPPLFRIPVAGGNFTCLNITGGKNDMGSINTSWCVAVVSWAFSSLAIPRSDLWIWCGGDDVRDKPDKNSRGLCGLVNFILPVVAWAMSEADLLDSTYSTLEGNHFRRALAPTLDPTYIDAIGVPRGVPDEYKLVDQIAAGFESTLCWWCTINKNVDRINYIHYNVQKLANKTEEGFSAVAQQLHATSLMAFQNRVALDMLLAEKGGVCAMFGEMCCTFIPNNTAPDGSLTLAIDGLRALNRRLKEQSGVDTSYMNGLLDMFGRYKTLVASVLTSLAVFAAILTLCGCCCIPCIRALLNRLITTALTPAKEENMALMVVEGWDNSEDDVYNPDGDFA